VLRSSTPNVVRVVGRVYGLDLHGEPRRRRAVADAIDRTCDPNRPRDFYYGVIDLAHTLCLPADPDCLKCPLYGVPCQYAQNQPASDGERSSLHLSPTS